MTKTIICSKI